MPISLQPVSDKGHEDIRQYFPAICQNSDIIHFDNAATTQVAAPVLSAVQEYYERHANPGRGGYDWAEQVSQDIEVVRGVVANFVGFSDSDGVVFTSGATMALNMVVQCWAQYNLQPGDEVLLCHEDHHGMVLPWIKWAQDQGVIIRAYKLHQNGSINVDDMRAQITARTKICCVTHINNTVGWVNDLKAIRDLLPDYVMLNVDVAQSISHTPIRMDEWGVDFLSFSGHKMYALSGIGVLCVSSRAQKQMHPLLYGGGMAEYKGGDPFYVRFEAGTLHSAGIASLGSACMFIQSIDADMLLGDLTQILYERLLQNPRIDLLYEQKPYALDRLSGIASFTVEGIDCGELADILSEYGIFVRAGRQCSGAKESVRVSLQIYNRKDEVLRFCDLLDHIIHDALDM